MSMQRAQLARTCGAPALLYLHAIALLPQPLASSVVCGFAAPCAAPPLTSPRRSSRGAAAAQPVDLHCHARDGGSMRRVCVVVRCAPASGIAFLRLRAAGGRETGCRRFMAAREAGPGGEALPSFDQRAPEDLHVPVLAEEVAEVCTRRVAAPARARAHSRTHVRTHARTPNCPRSNPFLLTSACPASYRWSRFGRCLSVPPLFVLVCDIPPRTLPRPSDCCDPSQVFRGVGGGIRRFIDGTLGMGGHSSAICSEHWDTLQLLMGIDQDPAALLMAGKRLHAARAEGRAVLVSGNFEDMGRLAAENGIEKESVDGILLDIGTSSLQLDEASILKSHVYSDFIFSILGH